MTERQSRELDDRVTHEALAPVFAFMRRDALSHTLIPLTVIAVMWSQIDHRVLIGWGLLMGVGLCWKYVIGRSYHAQEVPSTEVRKWGRRVSQNALFLALLWSSSIFLFFVEGSVAHQVFLFTLIVLLSMSAVIGGFYWLPLFYLRAVPMLASLAVCLFIQDSFAYKALAVLLVWGLFACISFARLLNSTMWSEKRLRHESVALSEALQGKAEEAQKAALGKSRFLAAASHDLRQPLHTLSLFLDALRESKSDQERASIFPRIDLSLDALRKLFDALLDVSRLDAKVVQPEISHFDLAELLEELVEGFTAAAREKGLVLKIHAGPSIVVTDRLLLERVLRNLVGNAIRYTDSGGVLLSARKRGDDILLQVWDTGIGIPRESQDEIFVEFQQLHNAHRDRAEGLGLGLALVRRLCKLLNHPLHVRSQPGKGSVFSVCIPRGRAELLAGKEAMIPAHSWDLSGRRVLVIDDERAILDAMQTLLSKWGCEVLTGESLEDAIEALNARRIVPELILSDLRLRDERTGIEAIDSLRERFGVPIAGILITGDTDPEQIKAAKASGYELLQKPVRPAHLRTVIHHHLSDTPT